MRREPGNEVDYFSRVGSRGAPRRARNNAWLRLEHTDAGPWGESKGNKEVGGEKIYHFLFFFSPSPLLSSSSALVTNGLPYGLLFLLSQSSSVIKSKMAATALRIKEFSFNRSKNKIRLCTLTAHSLGRLQNSPYFCVFKYAQAVKQKVWNEAVAVYSLGNTSILWWVTRSVLLQQNYNSWSIISENYAFLNPFRPSLILVST